jgi:hypothetical protein
MAHLGAHGAWRHMLREWSRVEPLAGGQSTDADRLQLGGVRIASQEIVGRQGIACVGRMRELFSESRVSYEPLSSKVGYTVESSQIC